MAGVVSEELGECPNNTESTVCLTLNCPYKHDRVWPIPPAIQKAMERELDYEAFYAERVKTLQPIEWTPGWTPEHEISFESYVDRMLKTQTKCPCGCGGQFIPPAKKASIETIQCSNCEEVVLMTEFGDHYCKEYQQKEADDAQGN